MKIKIKICHPLVSSKSFDYSKFYNSFIANSTKFIIFLITIFYILVKSFDFISKRQTTRIHHPPNNPLSRL